MVGQLSKSRSYYEELAESADLYDNILLTEDKQCPSDILDSYHDDMNYRIKYNVANNSNTSQETLLKMYDKFFSDISMRIYIINNINCPLSILEYEIVEYRSILVASCPTCPDNLKMAIRDYLWLTYMI